MTDSYSFFITIPFVSTSQKNAKKIWFLYFLNVYLLPTYKKLALAMIKLSQEKNLSIKGGGNGKKDTPPGPIP